MSFYLSLKLLFSLKRKTFHSFFLFLSIFGIFLGVFSLIIIISFMESAQDKIKENYLKNEPHITIEPLEGMFFKEDENFEKNLYSLSKDFKVEKLLVLDGFLRDYKGKIKGKDNVKRIAMPTGDKGETYCFTIPEIVLSPFGPTLKKICLQKEEEGPEVEVPLKILQNLLGKENIISSYNIFLQNPEKIENLKDKIKEILPVNLKVETIYEKKVAILYALKIEKFAMAFGVFLILFVSIFQLYFSLKLLFFHYRSSWAILKVFGFPEKGIKNVFKLFCFYIFSISSLMGFLSSVIFIKIQNHYHFFPFPEDLQHFSLIKYKIPSLEFLLIFFFLLFLSFLIGEIIGYGAKKINIQETLRVPQ